LIKNKISKTI